MNILVWCLYLVVTMLISIPFATFIFACIFEVYYRQKARYMSKMLKAVGDGVGVWSEQLKKASAIVKKEKENA